MGHETNIAWADHTWNPWRGCARVSPGCEHCYAEAMSRRNPAVLGTWGAEGTRPLASETYWSQPARWNREAIDSGARRRVFCGSLMDVWEDRSDLDAVRERLLMLAYECHHLDWLFLTKRPQNILCLLSRARHLHHPRENWLSLQQRATRPNWWFGCTVEDNERARQRIPLLCAVPARVRFLSCEPLLESLDLTPWLASRQIHWVIVGGESNQGGAEARHFDIVWAEEIACQCRAFKVPVFVKQMGSRPLADGLGLRLKDRHGGDMTEWPDWLRVREVPV